MNTKAVVFNEPWQVSVETREFDPSLKSDTDIIVENQASIISAGTEMACLSGIEDWFPLPGIPGYGACGIVRELGSKVTHIQPGDRVYTYGPHSGVFRVDSEDRYHGLCLRIPDTLPPDRAVFARMGGISFAGVRTARIELGDWALVTGMGLVGNLAAQLAQLQGARVIAADISSKRLELARACGVRYAIQTTDPEWHDQVRRLTGPSGVDILIEGSGLSAVLEGALDLVGMHGEIILLGSPRTPHETDLTGVFRKIHLPPFLELKGALEWRFPTWPLEFVKHSIERNIGILFHLIEQEKLVLDPLYTHKMKPESAEAAYFGLRDLKDDYIGVVFDWT